MKRTMLFLSCVLFTVVSFAQSSIIYNGEDIRPDWWPAGSAGDVGNHWDNPQPASLVNATASCATIWRNPGDDPWTGGGIGGLNIDVKAYNKISVMVLKDVAGLVQLELQNGISSEQAWLKQEYTTPGEWQKLEFEIPSMTQNITTLLVAPHLVDTKTDANFSGQRMYWDEVVAFTSTPTSTHAINSEQENIISSDVYSITGIYIRSFGKERVDISDLAKGIYLIQQTDENGNKTTKKVSN